jgi:rare lipoprotein A (peptidoglycan hydrolase)
MTIRTKRVFPGMVVSMLLAGPAFAGTQAIDNTTIHTRKTAHPIAAHRPSIVAQRKAAPARNSTASRTPPLRVAERARDEQRTSFVEDTSVWSDSPAAGRSRGGWQQTGLASWYGGARWRGHMTASGARYDENELTAAHAWLPIGTRVVVALSGSGRSVIVTINDRPGTHRRVIDLSREAARQLGIMGQGVATVTLTPL